jgi:hypothetical protein
VIFYTSSLPGDEIHLPPFRFSDKAVHFAAYAVLGLLIALRMALRAGAAYGPVADRGSSGPGRWDFAGMAIGALYGVGDEIHQLFVPQRMFDYSDMAADFLGVTAGIWIGLNLLRSKRAATAHSSEPD